MLGAGSGGGIGRKAEFTPQRYISRRTPARTSWVAVAAKFVGVGGGELAGAVEEVADHSELVVGVGGQQVAGLPDKAAEDFPVPGSGGLGDLHHLAAAVSWIGLAADIAGPLEPVQHGGD